MEWTPQELAKDEKHQNQNKNGGRKPEVKEQRLQHNNNQEAVQEVCSFMLYFGGFPQALFKNIGTVNYDESLDWFFFFFFL